MRLMPMCTMSSMLNFQFMRHDKWANVLFVHWSVPTHLESLLLEELNGTCLCSSSTVGGDDDDAGGDATNNAREIGKVSSRSRFFLDRYKDGRAYVGLILLTEVNVGPICGRSIKRLLVTHHGANIRTYVRPAIPSDEGTDAPDGLTDDDQLNNQGITFASLECDDAITAAGANVFGMPYKVAKMERTYHFQGNGRGIRAAGGRGHDNSAADDSSGSDCQALVRNNVLSTEEVDDLICGGGGGGEVRNGGVGRVNAVAKRMGIRSARTTSTETQGMIGKVKSMVIWSNEEKHKSKLVVMSTDDALSDNEPRRSQLFPSENVTMDTGYSLDCEWEVNVNGDEHEMTDEERDMANFFCERYHVYTRKYGLHWKGTVTHEPWLIEKAKIRRLSFDKIDQYEPSHMRPLLRHMSETSPDSVLYSSGVGPVDFQMLKPV